MGRFRILMLGLGMLLHGYVGLRLISALSSNTGMRETLWIFLLLSGAMICYGMRYRKGIPSGVRALLMWMALISMGFFALLLTFTLMRDVLLGIFALGVRIPIFNIQAARAVELSSEVARISAMFVVLLSLLALLKGIYNARRRAPIVDVEIPVKNLTAPLAGFTIVQLSDLHVGRTIRKGYIDAIVDKVNELDADIVVITGDVVDGSVRELTMHTAPLSRLRAKHGVYLVTGNHEYYSGAEAWIAEFRRLGLRVLLNEHSVINVGAESIVLAGVADYSAASFVSEHRSTPSGALLGAPGNGALRILLAHQPRSSADAEAAGFDVQLSGHTHGGQIFPVNFLVPLQQPHTAGLVRYGNMWLYVSRGTGYAGPPVRFGAPSEISRIRFTRNVA